MPASCSLSLGAGTIPLLCACVPYCDMEAQSSFWLKSCFEMTIRHMYTLACVVGRSVFVSFVCFICFFPFVVLPLCTSLLPPSVLGCSLLQLLLARDKYLVPLVPEYTCVDMN
jgi:hypothetical protein